MSNQPVFEARYVEKRSRLTTFFRAILAIPHFIVLYVWSLVAFIAVIVAWFALLFTGRYPEGLYSFVAGFMRYATAVYGYIGLLTDEYPPFSSDTSGYPVTLETQPALSQYDRLKVLFRIILAIPVVIIMYAMQIVWEVGALLAWFAIVILGRQPKGLQDMIVLGLSYQQRAYAYLFLLTESWPPFTDQRGGSIEGGPGPEAGGTLPPAAERPTEAMPAASGSFAPPEAPASSSSESAPAPAPEAPTTTAEPAEDVEPKREPPPGDVTSGDPLRGE